MAVTKAQIAVWGLIAGLSVWGVNMLSRVKLPDDVLTPAPVAAAVAIEQQPRSVLPEQQAVRPVAVLPANIPEFPFPDDLVTVTVAEPEPTPAPRVVESFAEVPTDAIPEISAFEGETELIGQPAAVAELASEPDPVASTVEQPPIPRPARPMMARAVEAVPLAEVKTLYVVADMLNVRAVPSTTGPVLQKLPQGFAVAPRQRANEWIGFLMQDGSTGWMRTDYLSDTMPAPSEAPAETTVPTGTEPMNLMM
jgi:hypothetical protein